MAAPPLPSEVARLREQLLRDQAPSARKRANYYSLDVLQARLGSPYTARKLPLSTLYEMRTDAILRFAQLSSLVQLFTAKWRIESGSARKAQFIDHALRRILGRWIMQAYESWNFGWASLVKEFGLMMPSWSFVDKDAPGGPRLAPVWDGAPDVPALVWEPFVPLRPENVSPVYSESGSFNGIALKAGYGGYGIPTVDILPIDVLSDGGKATEGQQKVDLDHSLWLVNERDGQFGSPWGFPRLGYAHKFWRASEMTLGILNRSVERKGDPTIIVSYPQGKSRDLDGAEVDNQEVAFRIGELARSGSVLVIPSEVWGEDQGTSNQTQKWRVETLKFDEQFDKLREVLSYLDVMKFRSMQVSELSLAEGSGGTSSRNVAGETSQRTAEVQIFSQTEWDEVINKYMIPQLADVNFPELRDEPARKVTQAFGEDEAQLAAELLRSYANADPTALPMDLPAMLERFQIDALEGEQLAAWERRMIKQAEESKPAPAPAKPSTNGASGAAGTTDTGFYYDPPERIELAEDETLLASLPPTKHYEDRVVLAQTRLIRRLWRDLLAAQYEDFARSLEREDAELADLDLAAGDPATRRRRVADALVKGWRFASKSYVDVVERTAKALSSVFARAGAVELGRASLPGDGWKPGEGELAKWVSDNAAAMVRGVEKTTRKQLREYLYEAVEEDVDAAGIAKGLRAHFAEFPSWRADLIAREEVRRFYNAATLFAAQSAGTKQVQALDARVQEKSDPDCIARNGRFFTIEEAFREDAKTHPRDTLAWRIFPPEVALRVEYVARDSSDGYAARVSREEGVVYLTEGMDPATEAGYLLQVGGWIEAVS